MRPTNKGRFCSQCQKEVIDFRAFSDDELFSFFKEKAQTGSSVCGIMRKEQIHHPTQTLVLDYGRLSSRHLIYLALLVCFGNLFSSCREETVGEVAVGQVNPSEVIPADSTTCIEAPEDTTSAKPSDIS